MRITKQPITGYALGVLRCSVLNPYIYVRLESGKIIIINYLLYNVMSGRPNVHLYDTLQMSNVTRHTLVYQWLIKRVNCAYFVTFVTTINSFSPCDDLSRRLQNLMKYTLIRQFPGILFIHGLRYLPMW